MKRLIFCAMGVVLLFASSCKKDKQLADNGRTLLGTEKPLVTVPGAVLDTLIGDITVNTTVTENTFLKGIVYVRPGVTLTINPGITIYGSTGPDVINPLDLSASKGTLVVEKGGKLIANGTSTQPIVWTCDDKIAVGSRTYGLWGGIVILGDAPIAASVGGVCSSTNTFEAFNTPGFPNPTRHVYGGPNAADNSGSLQYNRLEFGGGGIIAANKELNGLTLCGVGSGTTLLAVETSNAGDDGFEFFGGTVNGYGLISFGNKDDDFDFDEGYKGKLQFIIAYRTTLADNSGSHFIESDNTPTATLVCPGFRTQPFISNASFVASVPGAITGGGFFDSACVQVRRSSALILANSIVANSTRFTRFVSTTATTTSLVASGTSLSGDSIYIGVNSVEKAISGVAGAESGIPITSTLTLPLQGPSVNPLSNIFTLPGGFNLNSVNPFFISTTQQGAVPSTLNWISGTWVSTATN